MSLSDLASLGSFVSGVAVLASLALLYLQMRQIRSQIEQTERNQRASIRSERSYRTVDLIAAMLEPAAADAYYLGFSGMADLSPTQIRQFSLASLARFLNAEDTFSQHENRLLDETSFTNLVLAMKTGFRQPGFRAAWRIFRTQFNSDFVSFMDNLLAETQAEVVDHIAQWRALFEAERAKALA